MRVDGTFIGIEIADRDAADPQLAHHLQQVCPVDIYAQADDGAVEIVERNVDECVLCGLCLEVPHAAEVRVLKLYEDGAPLRRVSA